MPYSALVLVFVLGLALVFAFAARQDAAAEPEGDAEPKPVTVKDLAWIAGTWRGKVGEDVVEEIWSEPAGRSMAGVFRWMKGDGIYMYEILALEQDDEGVGLLMRHFGKGLVPWESEGEKIPVRKCLDPKGQKKAVFEDPAIPFPKRIVYELVDAKTLTVRLEGEKNGQPAAMEFRFTKQ